MEQENIAIGEQPEADITKAQSGIVGQEEGAICEEADGSLGKFKDTESLLTAYNNLQAEFTKKCQKLSEVVKELDEKNSTKETPGPVPVYGSENWKQQVENFLNNNLEAKKYSAEIAREIAECKDLQFSPHALELAWAKVMQKNYYEPEVLANDQNFITEKILSQSAVKQQVLDEYFKNSQNFKTPPVISSSGVVASVATKKPEDLKQAKALVEQLFNLKGN